MNIFFLSRNPILAAQYQCDKHVVKMVLESAQLLSTTYNILKPNHSHDLYKTTHRNHPCAKWARENLANYRWLVSHARALSEEYSFRYGKVHKSSRVIDICNRYSPFQYKGIVEVTEPPQAMPDEYKDYDSVVAYRRYYFFCKGSTIKCEWTKRSKPWWWKEIESEQTIQC